MHDCVLKYSWYFCSYRLKFVWWPDIHAAIDYLGSTNIAFSIHTSSMRVSVCARAVSLCVKFIIFNASSHDCRRRRNHHSPIFLYGLQPVWDDRLGRRQAAQPPGRTPRRAGRVASGPGWSVVRKGGAGQPGPSRLKKKDKARCTAPYTGPTYDAVIQRINK